MRVSGELVYKTDTPLPKAATARVSMIEHGENGGDKRIVAERSLHKLGRTPVAFTMNIGRDLIDPDGRYGLRAEILSADGKVLWHTLQPTAVQLEQRDKSVSLELKPVLSEANLAFRTYQCADGFHMSAARADGEAVVRMGKRRLLLESQSGENGAASFSDEHGNRLQIGQAQTTFRVDGNDHTACQTTSDQQASTSG